MVSYTPNKVNPELASRLQAMPKVEIHVHLEGATDAETVYRMAQKNQVDLPASSLKEWKSFYNFRDFPHFAEVYGTTCKCMQTPEDYAFIAEQFLRNQSEQNIYYSEAYFSPSLHYNKLPDDEIIDALAAGVAAGEAKYGSKVKFMADISRKISDLQWHTLEFALQGQKKNLFIGLGIGGLETGHPPENYIEVFTKARQQGLRIVAHAGETEGAYSIWGAIKSLKAERIGHGIRCLEDPLLVEELRSSKIPLEVSPQSNYCIGIVKREQPHPIRKMFDAGLYCTLNSDDPPMFSTNLNNEYITLAEQGFSWEELWKLNTNTLEASFLNEAEKAVYRAQWQIFLESV